MKRYQHVDSRCRLLACVPILAIAAVLLAAPVQAEDPKTPPASNTDAPKTDVKQTDEEKGDEKPDKEGWVSLFDGKSLGKWEIVNKLDFTDHGEVIVEDKRIILEHGLPATGIKWTGEFPKINYEIALEARRVYASDFFCGLTFPVGDKALTLVCGGWGGQVTGLSNIGGYSAIDNDTCSFQEYKENQWYRIRVRVSKEKIEAWLDDEQIVDLATEGRKLSLRWEMEPTLPLGVATWYTTGELRNIRYRSLDKKAAAEGQEPAPQPE